MTLKDIDKNRLLNVIGSLGWKLSNAKFTDTTTELTITKEYKENDTIEGGKEKVYQSSPL